MLRHRLGLDEQLVEGRMLQVRPVRRQGELDVAGEIQAAGADGPVQEGDPPNLDVVFGGDDDLRLRLDAAVDASEHGTIQREAGGIGLDFSIGGMIGVGPETIRIGLMDVAARSPQVPRADRTSTA